MNAQRRWLKVFQGQPEVVQHVLKLGYYCVKLPDDNERAKYSREDMEERAMAFLQVTKPWSELTSVNRVGVRALVANISTLLMRIIDESYVFIGKAPMHSPAERGFQFT